MNGQLHIMIARDSGKIVRFPCTIKKLYLFFSISISIILLLVITSFFSISLFTKNKTISSTITTLQHELKVNEKTIAGHEKTNQNQKLRLDLRAADLKLSNTKRIAALKEKDVRISTAINELNERRESIEKIMRSIGINLEKKKPDETKNKGGPFISEPVINQKELLRRTDAYLKKIQYIPLGRPVQGAITSRFGKRKDPINKKISFHTGIDFRGKRGEKIYATADGIVKKAFNNGSYGKYILISHGNGYTTCFAHLQTFLVKKGARIKKGQLIGLVGNTGRSTGPHLHYEINLDKKPINPNAFMKFDKLVKK